MSKIFLVGLMGSGKTYWAERLKKKFKVPAYDLDSLIEMMEERTVAEIFKEDGEEYFRKEESKMLRLFREKKQFILSCGGGTPCFHDNMEWMNKNGTTVWLNEPVEVLVQRLKQTRDHRPLMKDLAEEDLAPFLEKMLEQRKTYYQQASYSLNAAELNDETFKKIFTRHA